MFDSIILTGQNTDPSADQLDTGSLVEAMLLYGKVTVVANYSILDQIYSYFGGSNLLWLLREGFIKILYQEYQTGIRTDKIEGREVHNVIQFFSPDHRFLDELRRICIGEREANAGKRLAKKLQCHIRPIREEEKLLEGSRESILNPRIIQHSAKIIIEELIPRVSLDDGFNFQAVEDTQGILIETNADFDQLNKRYHEEISPKHSTITPAYILSNILKFEEEVYFAASSMSELSCSKLSARLGVNRINYLVERSLQGQEKFDSFKEKVFSNMFSIREAVNLGNIKVDELIRVLDSSRKYREWIAGIPYDAEPYEEYLKKISEKTFLELLPQKIVRYSVFTGLGVAVDALVNDKISGFLVGASLSAFDAFFLEKLIGGWKPNQYIDDQVKKIICK